MNFIAFTNTLKSVSLMRFAVKGTEQKALRMSQRFIERSFKLDLAILQASKTCQIMVKTQG